MDPLQVQHAVLWYFVFLFSTTCHEAAHALVAKRLGDPTAYNGGQVSLNPLPHIKREPFGMVLVPILSVIVSGFAIGWAWVPLDAVWAARNPRRHALVSLAGPLANLLLMLIGSFIYVIGLKQGFLQDGSSVFSGLLPATQAFQLRSGLADLVWFFMIENFLLATFNMIPLPPLDGSSAIRLILPRRAANTFWEYMRQPQFSFMGMFIAWRVYDRLSGPLFKGFRTFIHALRDLVDV